MDRISFSFRTVGVHLVYVVLLRPTVAAVAAARCSCSFGFGFPLLLSYSHNHQSLVTPPFSLSPPCGVERKPTSLLLLPHDLRNFILVAEHFRTGFLLPLLVSLSFLMVGGWGGRGGSTPVAFFCPCAAFCAFARSRSRWLPRVMLCGVWWWWWWWCVCGGGGGRKD